ncbi:MAG: hypothetical protein RBS53_00670 [Bacteroidales bacterium]|mgnify:CR=1 FL=1|jgi:heme/copper-type cytochrome/quinol oxidase subunit 2|nr:hypothetical protein [Bacteroidales bacterium]NLM93503.1 hypothetical protein [Bacteroidales bacterium]
MRILLILFLFLQSIAAFSQTPTHFPTKNEPVRFFETPGNIVLFIVIPVLVVFFYYLWRKRLRKEQEEREKEK